VRRIVVIGSAVAVLAIGMGTAWASTQRGTSAVDGPELRASALQGSPGDLITVEGSGCPGDAGDEPHEGDWEVQVWFMPAFGTVPYHPELSDPVAYLTPDDDGSWSTEIRVPEWRTDYQLEAGCFDEAMPPNGFVYAHELYRAR